MNAMDVPALGSLWRSRANDHVFDLLLLCGPLLVVLIVVVGRTPVTTVFAALYVLAFIGYVGYRRIDERDRSLRR